LPKLDSFSILLIVTAVSPLLYFSLFPSIPSNCLLLILIAVFFLRIKEHVPHKITHSTDREEKCIIFFLTLFLLGGLVSFR